MKLYSVDSLSLNSWMSKVYISARQIQIWLVCVLHPILNCYFDRAIYWYSYLCTTNTLANVTWLFLVWLFVLYLRRHILLGWCYGVYVINNILMTHEKKPRYELWPNSGHIWCYKKDARQTKIWATGNTWVDTLNVNKVTDCPNRCQVPMFQGRYLLSMTIGKPGIPLPIALNGLPVLHFVRISLLFIKGPIGNNSTLL